MEVLSIKQRERESLCFPHSLIRLSWDPWKVVKWMRARAYCDQNPETCERDHRGLSLTHVKDMMKYIYYGCHSIIMGRL